jgi:hypothetical protein
MLDQRLAEHAANPEAASPWIEVQQRVFGTRGY